MHLILYLFLYNLINTRNQQANKEVDWEKVFCILKIQK